MLYSFAILCYDSWASKYHILSLHNILCVLYEECVARDVVCIPAGQRVHFEYTFNRKNRGNTSEADKRIQPEILRRKKAVFRRHTLCMSRKNNVFPAEKIGCSPQAGSDVLPKKQ